LIYIQKLSKYRFVSQENKTKNAITKPIGRTTDAVM